jgi:hypothetical protein
MDPNMISQLLGGSGTPVPDSTSIMPEMPQEAPQEAPQAMPEEMSDPSPLMVEALDKLQNMGIPFVGDIVHLLTKGGGSVQSWKTLLKTIDAYGKHKDSVVADNIGNGSGNGQSEVNNPQPPGSYQF